MRKIFTCVDIGTDTIKAITVEEYNEKFNVLATATSISRGVKKGLIIDASLVTSSIKKVLKELSHETGKRLRAKKLASLRFYFDLGFCFYSWKKK